ncbi:MAG: ABC transporter ATP-binding protein [candidate division WOR-3 bacterium]
MIRFDNLYKRYGRKTVALEGLSFTVPEGIFCLLGPNGAGKTTLIKIACGVLLPDQGDVIFDGESITRRTKSLQRRIAAVFENAENAYGYLSVQDNLMYFGYLWGIPGGVLRRRVNSLLERLGLLDKRKESFTKLSRGMKQKVAVAMAMIREPSYLFLDEPTLGLDVFSAETVKEMIREWASQDGRTVVLTTHNMALAEDLGQTFGFISKGKVIWEGKKEDLTMLPGYRVEYRITVRGRVPEGFAGKQEDRDGLSVIAVSRDELGPTLFALRKAEIVEITKEETKLEDLFREVMR